MLFRSHRQEGIPVSARSSRWASLLGSRAQELCSTLVCGAGWRRCVMARHYLVGPLPVGRKLPPTGSLASEMRHLGSQTSSPPSSLGSVCASCPFSGTHSISFVMLIYVARLQRCDFVYLSSDWSLQLHFQRGNFFLTFPSSCSDTVGVCVWKNLLYHTVSQIFHTH